MGLEGLDSGSVGFRGCASRQTNGVWAGWSFPVATEPAGGRLVGVGVDRPGSRIGDHELELAAGRAGELLTALDGDLWGLHAEPEEVLGDGLV
jgi:hypothetical protein